MNDGTCRMCDASLQGKRSDAKYCSRTCAKRYWDTNNLDRKRELDQQYRVRNRDAINCRVRESRKQQPDVWRERDRRRRNTQAYHDWWAAYERDKSVKAASDRAYREANRETISAKWNEWAKENRHRTSAYRHKRRAAEKSAEGHATPQQIRARVEYYGGKCWMCRSAEWEHIDHVKPLAAGGCNWPANLRPACAHCNSSKRHTWPFVS